MTHLIVQGSNYLFLFLLACYLYGDLWSRKTKREGTRRTIALWQMFLILCFHGLSYLVLFEQTKDQQLWVFYAFQALFFIGYRTLFRLLYPGSSGILCNHLGMLMLLGLVLQTRLLPNKAWNQFLICVLSAGATILVPLIMKYWIRIYRIRWLFGLFGIVALGITFLTGKTEYGAKLSVTIGNISMQLSEIVKVSFVFFVAASLCKEKGKKKIFITSLVAGAHVLVLIGCKDLGGALILFWAYLCMLYTATRQPFYLLGGGTLLGCGCGLAYQLFSHVRVRVATWQNPWLDVPNTGWQIAQSLFAISAGGWLGVGLYEGMPKTIPVVLKDFIFAAICEELGILFACGVLLIYMSCIDQFLRTAWRISEDFHQILIVGLGSVMAIQVFLNVGGVIKLIPMTGVTLPLISYGGSSALSTFLSFCVVQGCILMEQNVEKKRQEEAEREKQKKIREERRKEGVRKKQSRSREEKKAQRQPVILYLMPLLLVSCIGYLLYFQIQEAETVSRNPYNKRIEAMAKRILRGRILSQDGSVLAQTVENNGEDTRFYPYGEATAFVTGYTDRGKTSVESMANADLLSSHQTPWEKMMEDLKGERYRGDDVVTTIDLPLQLTAVEAMGGRKGAAVVLEVSTGKILAMVSNPAYDPNRIGIDWEKLISESNQEANLLNRVTKGLYPPGSTFKLVTLLAFMEQYPDTWRDYTYDCRGVNVEEKYSIRCYGGYPHGHQDIRACLVNSCNGAFGDIAMRLSIQEYQATCNRLLFNQSTDFSLPVKTSRFTLSKEASDWLIARTGIGQGQTQITPLESVLITGAIANGGRMMKPYLIQEIRSRERVLKTYEPEIQGQVMSEEEAEALQDLMRSVITEGTADSLKTDTYTAYGKTGTAEYITGSDETHAWFTGFAGEEGSRIAVSIIIEGGGTGSKAAAPVGAEIFQAYFRTSEESR